MRNYFNNIFSKKIKFYTYKSTNFGVSSALKLKLFSYPKHLKSKGFNSFYVPVTPKSANEFYTNFSYKYFLSKWSKLERKKEYIKFFRTPGKFPNFINSSTQFDYVNVNRRKKAYFKKKSRIFLFSRGYPIKGIKSLTRYFKYPRYTRGAKIKRKRKIFRRLAKNKSIKFFFRLRLKQVRNNNIKIRRGIKFNLQKFKFDRRKFKFKVKFKYRKRKKFRKPQPRYVAHKLLNRYIKSKFLPRIFKFIRKRKFFAPKPKKRRILRLRKKKLNRFRNVKFRRLIFRKKLNNYLRYRSYSFRKSFVFSCLALPSCKFTKLTVLPYFSRKKFKFLKIFRRVFTKKRKLRARFIRKFFINRRRFIKNFLLAKLINRVYKIPFPKSYKRVRKYKTLLPEKRPLVQVSKTSSYFYLIKNFTLIFSLYKLLPAKTFFKIFVNFYVKFVRLISCYSKFTKLSSSRLANFRLLVGKFKAFFSFLLSSKKFIISNYVTFSRNLYFSPSLKLSTYTPKNSICKKISFLRFFQRRKLARILRFVTYFNLFSRLTVFPKNKKFFKFKKKFIIFVYSLSRSGRFLYLFPFLYYRSHYLGLLSHLNTDFYGRSITQLRFMKPFKFRRKQHSLRSQY